jgi:hypothetical protein
VAYCTSTSSLLFRHFKAFDVRAVIIAATSAQPAGAHNTAACLTPCRDELLLLASGAVHVGALQHCRIAELPGFSAAYHVARCCAVTLGLQQQILERLCVCSLLVFSAVLHLQSDWCVDNWH